MDWKDVYAMFLKIAEDILCEFVVYILMNLFKKIMIWYRSSK